MVAGATVLTVSENGSAVDVDVDVDVDVATTGVATTGVATTGVATTGVATTGVAHNRCCPQQVLPTTGVAIASGMVLQSL